MAITLDTIVNKVFKVVKNGYDNNEVESFLDEILEEMENREAETNKLKEQVAQLTAELNQAKSELHKAQTAATVQPVTAPGCPDCSCAHCSGRPSFQRELRTGSQQGKGGLRGNRHRSGYPRGGNHQQGQSGCCHDSF